MYILVAAVFCDFNLYYICIWFTGEVLLYRHSVAFCYWWKINSHFCGLIQRIVFKNLNWV